jgi:hypothetical protein
VIGNVISSFQRWVIRKTGGRVTLVDLRAGEFLTRVLPHVASVNASIVLLVTAATLVGARPASGELLRQRIVSTSGVPHGDVANYRHSPYWRPGMPTGMNRAWRRFLRTEIADITSGADVVLHQGDQVDGRWGQDCEGRGVFGPVGSWAESARALTLAGNIYYSRMKRFWGDRDVLFGMGDHEIGDIRNTKIILPGTFKYWAHRYWNRVWRRHYGPSRYASRRGRVGIITLDPIMKTPKGIVAKISRSDLGWTRDKIAHWRANGVRWFLVQSEIPAIGPNRDSGSSGLLLRNGDDVWRRFASMGVDLFLAAEFHADTTYTRAGRTPVQVVHGGYHLRASWLVIDEYDDHLQLTLKDSRGMHGDDGTIWAPECRDRLPRRPRPGTPRVIGTMTIHADGTTSDRTGRLREGIF